MDYKSIIENEKLYKQHHQRRGRNLNDIDDIIKLYNERIQIDFRVDKYKQLKKTIGSEIKKYYGPNKNKEITDEIPDQFILTDQSLKDTLELCQTNETAVWNTIKLRLSNMSHNDLAQITATLKLQIDTKCGLDEVNKQLKNCVAKLGNLLHETVPMDTDKIMTQVDNYQNELLNDNNNLLGHYKLCQKTGIVNFEDGVNVAGNRGYYFMGLGVKLNRALISYALDFLENENYLVVETPHIMSSTSLEGVVQLEEFQETLYECEHNEENSKYLIATSEQPLTAMHRNKIIRTKFMPIKLAGLSHCYRKETGAHGKDTLGIFRVHQFEKVEQFCVTDENNSWKMMEQMIDISKNFYNSLGISYRIVNVHSQDLNNAAAMKYDLEGYFPGADNKFKELVSCTNCTDFIPRKIHTKDDKKNYVHMLNATLCANTRTICCLLETYQTKTGVKIPDVLIPYMKGITEIPFVN
jgi:seryl-tRNA synthetase